MFYIYKIVNTRNGKMYIGQTNNPNLRWSQHKSNAKYNKTEQVVTRAMIKYGIDSFKFDVIVTCKSQEDVNITEAQLIEQYDARNPLKGYNVDAGGSVGPRPVEINEKVSAGLKKYYETHDSKRKGTVVSDDVKKRMSESAMGKAGTNLGKKFDDEWRLAIAKSQTGAERKSSRRFPEEVEKEICLLYVEEEMSMYGLGKKFDCAGSLVRDILIRNNIASRQSSYTGHSNGKNIFNLEKELEICELYKGGTVSRRELAIKYNCGKTTIRDILIRNGIR
jgi:group I intron endonuclease